MEQRFSIHIPRSEIEAFCKRWQITELALFGSVLRDDFGPESDVDVMVTFAPEARHSLFDHVDMQDQLSEIFRRKVDLISRKGITQSRNNIRRKEILHSMEVTAQGPAAVALLANRTDARLEPLLIKIMPGEEEPHFREHDADTLLYVLEGEATLISEMGEESQLLTGDMAYYVNYPRKRLANRNQEQPLLVISITSPPTSSLDELIDMRQAAVNIPSLGDTKED